MDEICEIKNEKRILDAIDQLRRRKARPDVDRICNYMMRKFLIDPGETVADLERLVEADVVIKVEYKGNISYRNAAKWSRYALYKNRPESSSILTLNSERMSALVAAALTELSSRDTSPPTGVSYGEIETYLQRQDAHFSKKFLDSMILRELRAGKILRLGNGNFVRTAAGKDRSTSPDDINTEEDVVKENEKEIKEIALVEESEISEVVNNSSKTVPKSNIVNGKSGESQNTRASESGAVTVSGFRIGVRRKRAKIVFDPSDHRAPAPRKRGRPAGSSNKNNHHQHHNSGHVHHGNNPSNNHSHISNSSNSSNGSTNGNHGHGGVHLGGSGRHQLDLKDQIFKAHRVPAVVPSQANNDSKRTTNPCNAEGHCFVCGQGPNSRGNERLIDCRDCITNKVHPRCLEQYNGGVASSPDGDSPSKIIKQSNVQSWQCADCRSCCICEGVSDQNSMISCDGCEEWYHIYCHIPTLNERPRSGKWFCHHCAQDQAYAQSVNGVGGLPTPRESPIPEGNSHSAAENGICENGTSDIDTDTKSSPCLDNGEGENKNSLANVKQKIAPDASNWAPIDVELYFRNVGFPEQAHVFREQEVDGKSLLLMKRSDVLTGLGLKLGPALKMYTHVRRLQLRQHDDMTSSDFVWT